MSDNTNKGELLMQIEALRAQVEQLQENIFELQCFDVDVIRCLKTMAFEHNHADIKRYQQLAKDCMDRISSGNKADEIKAQAVEEFGRWIKETDHLSAFPVHPSGLAIEYAKDLRQATKGGE